MPQKRKNKTTNSNLFSQLLECPRFFSRAENIVLQNERGKAFTGVTENIYNTNKNSTYTHLHIHTCFAITTFNFVLVMTTIMSNSSIDIESR